MINGKTESRIFRTFSRSPGSHRVLLLNPALRHAGRFSKWVDLGCGSAEATRTVRVPKTIERVSVDVYDGPDKPAGFINADIRDHVDKTALTGCLVTLLDVIEHFERDQGREFLHTLERKADSVCIFTPDGFYRQDAESHPETAQRPEQWHRSGWTPEEFSEWGYDVIRFPRLHSNFGGFAAIRSTYWNNRRKWERSIERLHIAGLLDYYASRLHLKK